MTGAEEERPGTPGDLPAEDLERLRSRTRETIRRLLENQQEQDVAALSGEATAAAQPPVLRAVDELPSEEQLVAQERTQTMALKERYAKVLLRFMGAQIIVADLVFIAYAWAGVGWEIPSEVMLGWLSATVVQVIGVVLVVTRSLFPNRDGGAGT